MCVNREGKDRQRGQWKCKQRRKGQTQGKMEEKRGLTVGQMGEVWSGAMVRDEFMGLGW